MQFDFRGGRKELLGFTPRHDRRSVRRGVRSPCQVDATGVIARVVRGVRRYDRGRGVGVAFDRLSTFDRALLLGSLHGRPPLAPGRDLRRDYASAVIAFAAV